ncbi:MAG: sigma-70 family RNA polymerase sigma factor [Oscillospiraceae bacterium]|nr:sigma-70 family RNA polymerase sigma factor [Oscillospiraceae bacterium]
MNDEEIIALYFERNEDAIDETAKKYGAYCRAVAENILHDSEDSDEILNSSWLFAWNSIPPNSPKNLRIYLAKITRSLSINRLQEKNAAKRGGKEIPAPFDELSECLPSGENIEENFIGNELSESINRFIEKLPEKERNIFIRRYFFCESLCEIGEKFKISQNGAAVILWRTRKKLKNHLKKEDWTL